MGDTERRREGGRGGGGRDVQIVTRVTGKTKQIAFKFTQGFGTGRSGAGSQCCAGAAPLSAEGPSTGVCTCVSGGDNRPLGGKRCPPPP